MTAIRIHDEDAVRRLVLCRPDEYNTITVELRDELDAALEQADRDRSVKVVLLSAEGKAFCAGFGLDWSTLGQATAEASSDRVWDTVADVQMIGTFGNTFAKLHSISKPTLASRSGLVHRGRHGHGPQRRHDHRRGGRSIGYPPARVWGVPEAER